MIENTQDQALITYVYTVHSNAVQTNTVKTGTYISVERESKRAIRDTIQNQKKNLTYLFKSWI